MQEADKTATRFSFVVSVGSLGRVPGAIDATNQLPAIDGWFATDDAGLPHLIAGKCTQCGTYVFPPRANNCPNPACTGDDLEQVPLSRRGKVWSYTENRYPPPAPYPAADPFVPFAIAAVELDDEGLITNLRIFYDTVTTRTAFERETGGSWRPPAAPHRLPPDTHDS